MSTRTVAKLTAGKPCAVCAHKERDAFFQMMPEVEEQYHEWVQIPGDAQLAGYASSEKFEAMTQSANKSVDDVMTEARNHYRFLTAS